jgi:hypothetical protein
VGHLLLRRSRALHGCPRACGCQPRGQVMSG